MQSKQITIEDILCIPIFHIAFLRNEFKDYLEIFVAKVNKGSIIGDCNISDYLKKEYNYLKPKEYGKRTVYYLFVLVFELENRQYGSEEDKENSYYNLYLHFKDFYQNYDKAQEETGIDDFFKYGLVKYCLKLLKSNELENGSASVLSYTLYVYVINFYTIISVKSASENLKLFHFTRKIRKKN